MNTLRLTAAAAATAVALTLAACGGSSGETDTDETVAPSTESVPTETSDYTPGPLLDDTDVDGNTSAPDNFVPRPAPLGENGNDPFG